MFATEETTDFSTEEMPTLNHSFVCSEILAQLYKQQTLRPLPELTLAIEKGITPDISVYHKEEIKPNFLEDITRYEKLPILAIEIISPSQNVQDLLEKAKMMLQAGVRTVWTVEPFSNTIFVTDKSGTRRFHNAKVESDNITVDFAQIFGG